ncbi:Protein FAM214B [Acipenser ruthenus]|uniref:Protein FAM214B n=1 Tax=Acipenser ruthenus TaxID=7906 RepID=A0A444UTJ8_ACIRT|nr:Protein FAM214B [Acipenser ruthenus]
MLARGCRGVQVPALMMNSLSVLHAYDLGTRLLSPSSADCSSVGRRLKSGLRLKSRQLRSSRRGESSQAPRSSWPSASISRSLLGNFEVLPLECLQYYEHRVHLPTPMYHRFLRDTPDSEGVCVDIAQPTQLCST